VKTFVQVHQRCPVCKHGAILCVVDDSSVGLECPNCDFAIAWDIPGILSDPRTLEQWRQVNEQKNYPRPSTN